jgi:N-acetylgalactosamine-N,N'-diacetylbacillosaminyl-diphospho-undecaprenol 4-alpha-N-acetylgalactosaminyltransferase
VKKVAIFIYSLGGGGAEKAALGLVDGLKDEFEIEILTVSPVQNYDAKDIKVTSLYKHDFEGSALSKLLSIFKLAASLSMYCKANKIDTVVSFLSRPGIIAAFAKILHPKLRVIATEHTTLSSYYGDSMPEKAMKLLLFAAYKIANSVVAVSSGIKEDLVQNFGVNRGKISVIYNPIDIKKIKISALQKVSQESDGFVFVTAGRLIDSKNFPFLFEAFRLLPSFCKLWVLGDGELSGELRLMAVEMGLHERVRFFGFCENPYSYFASADCFVMSSRLEGLPTVLIEALACGLPVISTDCKSGPREILGGVNNMLVSGIEKGEFGLLVSLDSPKFLSIAMQKMIDEDGLRETFRANAQARAEFFSKEKSLEAYKNLIIGA